MGKRRGEFGFGKGARGERDGDSQTETTADDNDNDTRRGVGCGVWSVGCGMWCVSVGMCVKLDRSGARRNKERGNARVGDARAERAGWFGHTRMQPACIVYYAARCGAVHETHGRRQGSATRRRAAVVTTAITGLLVVITLASVTGVASVSPRIRGIADIHIATIVRSAALGAPFRTEQVLEGGATATGAVCSTIGHALLQLLLLLMLDVRGVKFHCLSSGSTDRFSDADRV